MITSVQNPRTMAEEEEEWRSEGTQLEQESCDDGDDDDTVTEGGDSGNESEEDQGDTQIAAQDIDLDAAGGAIAESNDAARAMNVAFEEEPASASRGAAGGGAGGGGDAGGEENEQCEPTQPTQVDSPDAPAPLPTAALDNQEQDLEDTMSHNPASLGAMAEDEAALTTDPAPQPKQQAVSPVPQAASRALVACAADRRRTPSPLRRAGRGSGVQLLLAGGGGGGAAGGHGAAAEANEAGTSSGFLSSAEPSAKAARARAALPLSSSSSSSPHPLPEGWLDEELDVAAPAAPATGEPPAKPPKSRKIERREHAAKGKGAGASTLAAAAPVKQVPPKKTSPTKAVAGRGGWIRTKVCGNAPLPRASASRDDDTGLAAALDAREGSVSQNIFAIGVPEERRVVGAAAGASATAEMDEDGDDEDEDGDMFLTGIAGTTVDSQEFKADDFSQIRKGCSQEKNEFDRLLDDEIAGAVSTGQGREGPKQGTGDGGEELPPASNGGGAATSGKRKRMRVSSHVAEGEGGGSSGGASGRKGASGSRTPGAYMGASASLSSSKKRALPRSLGVTNLREPNVFDMNSDDESSDGGGGVVGRPTTSQQSDRRRASKKSTGANRGKGKNKAKVPNPADDLGPPRRVAAVACEEKVRQEEEEEEEEESVGVDVRDLHTDDDDDDDDDDDQVVMTTQELRTERAMAAIRKDTTPVSAEDEEEGEEEEQEEEEGERGLQDGGEEEAQTLGKGGKDEKEVVGEGDEEIKDREKHPFRGEGADAEKSSEVGGRASIAAAGDKGLVAAADGGVKSPEWLTYKAMVSFLDIEGWKCVHGKGLHTWFYLLPGKKGRNGRYGLDFLVSEEEVVQHVRCDQPALSRYEAFLKAKAKAAAAAAVEAPPPTSSVGAKADRVDDSCPGDGGGGGGRRGADGPVKARPRHGKSSDGGGGIAGSSVEANVDPAAMPAGAPSGAAPAARPATTPRKNGRGNGRGSAQAGGRQTAEGPAPQELPPNAAGSKPGSGTGEAAQTASTKQRAGHGRRRGSGRTGDGGQKSDEPATRDKPAARGRSQGAVDWVQKWRDDWPKLQEDGWHWAYGNRVVDGCVYLKSGATKKTGRLGVDMFYSRQSVLEHVLESVPKQADPPVGGAAEPPVENGGGKADVDGTDDNGPFVEWSLGLHRVRRQKVQRTDSRDMTPPDAPPVEAMRLPGRAGGRRGVPSPPSAKKSSAGKPAGQKQAGSRQTAPRGKEGSKRGRGRPPTFPEGDAAAPGPATKRGRVGVAKRPSRKPRGGGEGSKQGLEMGGEDNSDGDRNDDMDDAPTQPQFELASAINMAEVGSRKAGGGGSATAGAPAAEDVSAGGEDTGDGPAGAPRDAAITGQEEVRTGESGSKRPQGSRSAPKSAHDSARTSGGSRSSGGGGGGGGGNGSSSGNGEVAGGMANGTPKRKVARSPPNSSSSAPGGSSGSGGGSGTRKKMQRSLTATPGVRSSSRRINAGPFSGLGVVLTGLRGEMRSELEASVTKLGGKVVKVAGGKVSEDDGWLSWILEEVRQSVAGGRDPKIGAEVGGMPNGDKPTPPLRRMITVATPDSDRTHKFQLALAAGMPIVHPSWVGACSSVATVIPPLGYILPLGRSALGDRGLLMPPVGSARGRPFQGKNIIFCGDGLDGGKNAVDNWVFSLTVAGATVIVLHEGGGGGGGDKKNAGAASPGTEAGRCTLESALKLVKDGQVFCVIGSKSADGGSASASTAAVEEAAEVMGTPAGSLEWATQCIIHGRLLLPNAGTCPWFPLGGSGGGSGGGGSGSVASGGGGSRDKKGKGRQRAGRGKGGRGAAKGEVGTSGEPDLFYVHLSGGKRYVAGDYVFLRKDKSAAMSSNGGGADAGTGGGSRAATAAAAAGGTAADVPPAVARVVSFRREAGGKVTVTVTPMKRGDGPKILVAPDGENGEEEEELDDDVLGGRVLLLPKEHMTKANHYAFNDSTIYFLPY